MWETQILITHWAKFQQHRIKEQEEIEEMAYFKAYSLQVLLTETEQPRNKIGKEIASLGYRKIPLVYYTPMYTILLMNLRFLHKTSKICVKKQIN